MSGGPLRVVSVLSEASTPFFRALVSELARRSGTSLLLDLEPDWTVREALIDQGKAQLCFLCGLLYARKVDAKVAPLEAIAAPVMEGERYGDRPVYFADVVVRADRAYRSFEDLRGARFCVNEFGSYSGYESVRYHLHTLGATQGYFSDVLESGSHLRSIERVLAGQADAASIDSTVLDVERARRPQLESRLRVVAVLGPSQIPPVAVSTELPAPLRQRLREALTTLHQDAPGRAVLAQGGVLRFESAADADYDSVRERVRAAGEVKLVAAPPAP